jgi:hypothetical protein
LHQFLGAGGITDVPCSERQERRMHCAKKRLEGL